MKKFIATAALLLVIPMLASAQSEDRQYRGQGYFFFAPAPTHHDPLFNTVGVAVSTGFGGEAFVYRGLGLGAEVGYAGPDWSFGSNGLGVGSADASYHFFSKKTHSKVEPFATGGYSLYFGHGETNGFNVGAGVNIWVRKHAALRLEVRDQAHVGYLLARVRHFVAFRIGVTFR